MKTAKEIKLGGPNLKVSTCMALSTFYIVMLAYPFGVTPDGYVVQRALVAGLVLFAISIPAWIINSKRQFFTSADAEEVAVEASNVIVKRARIGELALQNNWLHPKEIKQILFCQGVDQGSKFGEIAVKRNYLSTGQLISLLEMQGA